MVLWFNSKFQTLHDIWIPPFCANFDESIHKKSQFLLGNISPSSPFSKVLIAIKKLKLLTASPVQNKAITYQVQVCNSSNDNSSIANSYRNTTLNVLVVTKYRRARISAMTSHYERRSKWLLRKSRDEGIKLLLLSVM